MNSSETNLFVSTNELRKDHGLRALAQQEPLMDQARSWASALAAQRALEHSDPTQWNVAWTAVAENVGAGDSMDEIVQSLQASPDHRHNMLSTKYTHQAVGTARGKDGRIYAVQLFWRG
ncbi:MAG TPA: CAP domain-containing protein [Acidimicrobiales bacterium]|nr:CAP domain-containing protein [Acidimicrobiales bacterium]